MLTYEQARRTVIEQAQKTIRPRTTAAISVWDALGYVLAQDVKTDRPYPQRLGRARLRARPRRENGSSVPALRSLHA